MAKTKQKTHKIIQKEIRRLKTKPLIAGINKLRPVCFDKWKGLEVQKQKLEVPTHYYNEHTQEFINKSSCRIIARIAPAIDSTKRAIAEYRIISRNIINAEETADSESGQRALAVAMSQRQYLDELETELLQQASLYDALMVSFECHINKCLSISLLRYETYRRFAHASIENIDGEFKSINSQPMKIFMDEIGKVNDEIKNLVTEKGDLNHE